MLADVREAEAKLHPHRAALAGGRDPHKRELGLVEGRQTPAVLVADRAKALPRVERPSVQAIAVIAIRDGDAARAAVPGGESAQLDVAVSEGAELRFAGRVVVIRRVFVPDGQRSGRAARLHVRPRRRLRGSRGADDLARRPADSADLAIHAALLDRLRRRGPQARDQLGEGSDLCLVRIERPWLEPADPDLEAARDAVQCPAGAPAALGPAVAVGRGEPAEGPFGPRGGSAHPPYRRGPKRRPT